MRSESSGAVRTYASLLLPLLPRRRGGLHIASRLTPSPPAEGGEGRGEEARFIQDSPLLGPLPIRSSWGEEGNPGF